MNDAAARDAGQHVDLGRRAEVEFGALARDGDHEDRRADDEEEHLEVDQAEPGRQRRRTVARDSARVAASTMPAKNSAAWMDDEHDERPARPQPLGSLAPELPSGGQGVGGTSAPSDSAIWRLAGIETGTRQDRARAPGAADDHGDAALVSQLRRRAAFQVSAGARLRSVSATTRWSEDRWP